MCDAFSAYARMEAGGGVRWGRRLGLDPAHPAVAEQRVGAPCWRLRLSSVTVVMEDAFRACGSPALRPFTFSSPLVWISLLLQILPVISGFPQVELFSKCFSTHKLAAEGSIRGTLITFRTLLTFI